MDERPVDERPVDERPVEADVVFGPGLIPNFGDVNVPPIGPLLQGEQLATEAFDIGSASQSPIAELTADANTIVFYVNSDNGTKHAVAYDVSGLIKQYSDHNFVYECNEKKEAASVGDPADTKDNASTPYYKIELLGGVLVPVKQLLVALKSGHRHWLLRNKTRIQYTVSYKGFVNPAIPARTAIDPDTGVPYPNTMLGDGSARMFPINYDDEPVFGESASICKVGFDAYSLFPVEAQGGEEEDLVGNEEGSVGNSEGSVGNSEGSVGNSEEEGETLSTFSNAESLNTNIDDEEDTEAANDALLLIGPFVPNEAVSKNTGPTLLGRFGSAVSATTELLGKGVGAFLTPPELGRGPRTPRAPRIPPPEPRNPYLDPHVKRVLSSLYHPGHRPEPVESEPPVILADNPVAKEGDAVSAFVVWLDKVLVYKDNSSNMLSIPTGPATVGEPFVIAVRDILQKTTRLTPLPTAVKLLQHVSDTENRTHGYYYYSTVDKPEVAGLDGVDLSFNFEVAGEKAGDTGYWWATIPSLRMWLSQPSNEEFRTQEFVNLLRMLALKVSIGADLNEDDLRELPAWSKGLFDPKKISAACRSAKVLTNDCIAKAMRKDIFIGHDESRENRLAKRTDDPALMEYIRLTKAMEEETDALKKEALRIKLEKLYKDRTIYVRDGSDNKISTYTVPNPYRALSYREDPITTFANPAGGIADPDDESGYSASDDGGRGTMRQQNLQLLKELVPNEIIADKPMSIAILESLWYCGQNPTISNDPRCFPARLLGELREYQMNELQKNQAIEAKAVLKKSGWPALKLMLASLRQTIAGSKTFQYRADIFPPERIPEEIPVPDISGSDLSGAAIDISGAANLLLGISKPPVGAPIRKQRSPLPPMQTNVRIIPRQLGGSGITPILPRALGSLPPFVRAAAI